MEYKVKTDRRRKQDRRKKEDRRRKQDRRKKEDRRRNILYKQKINKRNRSRNKTNYDYKWEGIVEQDISAFNIALQMRLEAWRNALIRSFEELDYISFEKVASEILAGSLCP